MGRFLIVPFLAAAGLLAASQTGVAATIIDMPPPPPKAKIVETAPAATDEAEAEPTPDVGDIALARYRGARSAPSVTWGPVNDWRGWRGGRWVYGYWPHYPNWPDAYWGPGRYGCLTGGYRISISPWSYFGRRNRFGNYYWP